MAETLTELVAKIETDATGLKRGLSEGERATEASSKRMSESLKKVGIAMAASGAAITAALGLMGKAAIDEEINIKRLGVALKGVGVNYDDIKDSLEAVISATQRKTGIADDQQRDVLGRLILVTKDYNKALALLPLTLDLAAAGQMDAATAATYLSKAYVDLEGGAEQISIRLGQATVNFKNLDEVQKLVGGTAEATANPLNVLRATIGDLAEEIGSFLIPTIKDLVNWFGAVSTGVQSWIKLNPELVGQLVLSTAKLGLFLLTIGSLIVILPKIVGFITMLIGLLGPWGWAILAVAGFVGYLVAELLGLSQVMAGIKDIMKDVEKQMFIMRIEQALSAEEWAKIKEQGYLTEQQFINLAKAMNLSTEELYNQMVASGMLQRVMTTLGDTNIYLATKTKETSNEMDTLETMLNGVAKASKSVTREMEATKQSIARATWQADGYTYSMQLFTQAEIDAAKASGKKVESLKSQADVTVDNTEKAVAYKKTIDDATTSVEKFTETINIGNLFQLQRKARDGSEQAWYDYNKALMAASEQRAAITGETVSAASVALRAEAGIIKFTPEGIAVPTYQQGGLVENTGLAFLHEGERVIPEGEGKGDVIINFTQPVFFDREDTMNKFVDMIRKGIQRQDRLRFGGAYSG